MKNSVFNFQTELPERQKLLLDAFPELRDKPGATEDFYRWKYRGLPNDGPSSYEFVSRDDDDRMTGYYAALPFRYKIGKKKRLCGMVCDVMTHSSARGRGVFTVLGRYSLEQLRQRGLDFVSGYPIRPEVIPGHLKVGWNIAFELPIYMRFHRLTSLLKSRAKRLAPFLSPFLNLGVGVYKIALGARVHKGHGMSVQSLEDFLKRPDIDIFLSDWTNSVPNSLMKTKEFLKWRFSAPGAEYNCIVIERKDRTAGVAIARATVLEGISCLAILDLMVTPKNQKVSASLLAGLDRLTKEMGLDALVTMMSPTTAAEHGLVGAGFLRSPFSFKLIFNPLTSEVSRSELCEEVRWHLMWVDCDDL